MPRKYAWQKALDRAVRAMRGSPATSNIPEELASPVSWEESFATFAELMQQSDLTIGLHWPPFILGSASSIPSGTPRTGLEGVLYNLNGSLMWLGSSGTISTVAGS